MKTLILGGINEGRDLAELLAADGHEVITSLARRVRRLACIAGRVRVGGFGGVNGPTAWLVGNGIDQVVDATHLFAEQISTNAVAVHRSTGTPLPWVSRPNWASHPLADTWTWTVSHDGTSREAVGYEEVLLTVGKQSPDHYRNLSDVAARMAELPEESLLGSWWLPLERGLSTADSERELPCDLGVDMLATKDLGGSLTEAKLTAAAGLGVWMIMARHAPVPKGVSQVATPREALARVNEAPAWQKPRGRRGACAERTRRHEF